MKKEDSVDPLAGIILKVRAGSRIEKGDILAHVVASSSEKLEQASISLKTAFSIDSGAIEGRKRQILPSRIKDRYTKGLWLNP